MAERPILFNTDMVQAIQAGCKTQTRRLLRHIRAYSIRTGIPANDPPCKPGDILWVRETWCKGRIEYREEPDGRNVPYIDQCTGDDRIIHKEWAIRNDIGLEDVVWKPSIHMPKASARIFLRVKDVRAERLRDMSNADAVAEGFSGTPCNHEYADPALGCTDCLNTGWLEPPIAEFAQLWDATVRPADLDKYGWEANPWVWVITFERCDNPKGWC